MTLVCGFRNLSFPSKSRVRQQNRRLWVLYPVRSNQISNQISIKVPLPFFGWVKCGGQASHHSGCDNQWYVNFSTFLFKPKFFYKVKKKKDFSISISLLNAFITHIYFTKAAYLVQLVLSFAHKQPHMYGRR